MKCFISFLLLGVLVGTGVQAQQPYFYSARKEVLFPAVPGHFNHKSKIFTEKHRWHEDDHFGFTPVLFDSGKKLSRDKKVGVIVTAVGLGILGAGVFGNIVDPDGESGNPLIYGGAGVMALGLAVILLVPAKNKEGRKALKKGLTLSLR